MFSCPIDGRVFINILLKRLLLDKLGFTEVNCKPLSDLTLHTLQMPLIIKPEHQWCSHEKKHEKTPPVHTEWEPALSELPAAQVWSLRAGAATAPGLIQKFCDTINFACSSPLPHPVLSFISSS